MNNSAKYLISLLINLLFSFVVIVLNYEGIFSYYFDCAFLSEFEDMFSVILAVIYAFIVSGMFAVMPSKTWRFVNRLFFIFALCGYLWERCFVMEFSILEIWLAVIFWIMIGVLVVSHWQNRKAPNNIVFAFERKKFIYYEMFAVVFGVISLGFNWYSSELTFRVLWESFFYVLIFILAVNVLGFIKESNIEEKKKPVFFPGSGILLFFALLIFFAVQWIENTFGTVSADKLLFQIRVPLKGANSVFLKDFFGQCIFSTLVIYFYVFPSRVLLFSKRKGRHKLLVGIISLIVLVGFPILSSVQVVSKFSETIGLRDYVNAYYNNSRFIDENYADPTEIKLIFPERKRNLIYIFMESMECTYMSRELGGAMEENLIPELTEIAQENHFFSHSDSGGGAIQLNGMGWTIGGMVSQHTGLPLLIPIDGNTYNQYETFMPGAYSLGDILQEEGYTQTLLVGSDADFGGRRSFYEQHGNYKILDLNTAWEEDIVPMGRKVWWGFEDEKLYEYEKKELLRLEKEAVPFNLTMLTADTHHVGGYTCSLCGQEYSENYWNVIRCASRQLMDFLCWLKEQEFYENTTIVIVGDHLSMDPIVSDSIEDEYMRTIYNVYINSVNKNIKRSRLFSSLDMFPTTLSAMGVKIENDKLGLGVDLFSDTPTLLEVYGEKTVNEGLVGYSKIYNNILYGGTSKIHE